MARARELRPQARTQLDTVRDNLTALERALPNIRGMGDRAVGLLRRLDTVYRDMARLREHHPDIDLRSEETRLEHIEESIRGARTATLVREIAQSTGWDSLRTQVGARDGQWWWRLDEELARRRWALARQWVVRGAVALLILALVVVAYRQFLAPSPEVAFEVELTQRADLEIDRGDLEQALAIYQEAAAANPSAPELQVWVGVLYQQTGQPGPAGDAFRSAQRLSPSMYDFFLLRGRAYLRLDMPDQAVDDILAAWHIDPNSVEALFLLADALDRQGNYYEALDLFQAVSLRAEDPSLQVLAKVRYAMLLEAGPPASNPTPTPGGDVNAP
jgi:tetratricopeptide (TPR) repeat protein